MKTIKEQLSIAKIQLFRKSPFLANLVTMLPFEIDNNIPTACTNGKRVLINETFFTSLNQEEQQFLIAHEIMHIIYHHMTRRGNRNPQKWNCAGDYLINYKLVQQGFTMIQGCLYDKKYHDKWTTEQIYNDLPDNVQNPMDNDIEYTQSEEQTQQTEQEITKIIAQTILQMDITGQAGSVPDDIRRHIQELTKPKLDWKAILRRFLFELDTSDHTWNRPRRKMLTHGFYLPKLQNRNIGNIAFAIDTSGSISQKQFNEFISEVVGVFNTVKPKGITLMQFDTKVYTDQVNDLTSLKNIQFKGGGGTDINPVLREYIQSKNKALFVITDGEFFYKPIPCNKPVYWIIHSNPNFKPPYGKVICLT